MLKLGVVTVGGLARPRTFFGRPRHASFLLFQRLCQRLDHRAEAYDQLVDRVLLANGTWKQTASRRLADVDTLVLEILAETHAPGSPLTVMDVAASIGSTSVDFYDALRKTYAVDFTASDLYRDAFAVSHRSRRWTVIFDHRGAELQHIVGRFVLPGQLNESWAYPVNHALRAWSRRRWVPGARAALEVLTDRTLPYFTAMRIGEYCVVRLPMLSYRCLTLMQHDPHFRFEVADLLEPLPQQADVVRAMNIITPDHFDEGRATRALQHCAAAVVPGGLLVVGRSTALVAGNTGATVYRADSTLTRVARLNGGWELEHLVPCVALDESRARPAAPAACQRPLREGHR